MTILPKMWCVKGTKCKTVQQFFLAYKDNDVKDFVSHDSYENWFFFSENIGLSYLQFTDYKKHRDFTEISFDDFKRLVLNKNINNEMIIEIW